ncbi:MAG: dephospho-CoA kinase [Firmicutes bacterium]|jgi:dephospho-CoA kinase|nr:dephospho-CoA kinase [Bacillota bacterium]
MVIGITGPIGSGKSLITSELASLGAYVIDMDIISYELVGPGMPALSEIQREFGKNYISDQGALDRKALGKLVFSEPEALHRLNKIMFPKLMEAAKVQLDNVTADNDLVVIDAAVLYQAGLDRLTDKVIAVTAAKEIRIARIMKRDGLPYEEAVQRVIGQGDLDEVAVRRADFVLDNSGSPQALRGKLINGLRLLGINI